MPGYDAALAERFWARVDQSGGLDACWPVSGSGTTNGYGQVWVDVRPVPAHRVAWTLTHGEIPAGLFICHACDFRRCCNPAHLFLGTPAENTADMEAKGRHVSSPTLGEANHAAKLTEDSVRSIRDRLASGESQRKVATAFGVSQYAIWRIARGDGWTHVA